MEPILLNGINLSDIKKVLREVLEEKSNDFTKPVISEDQKYLSRKEVAKLLKISLTTLNDWSKQGIVQAYRIGNRVLYKKKEIEDSVSKVQSFKYKRG
jgi:excisionase family DNA binding protein